MRASSCCCFCFVVVVDGGFMCVFVLCSVVSSSHHSINFNSMNGISKSLMSMGNKVKWKRNKREVGNGGLSLSLRHDERGKQSHESRIHKIICGIIAIHYGSVRSLKCPLAMQQQSALPWWDRRRSSYDKYYIEAKKNKTHTTRTNMNQAPGKLWKPFNTQESQRYIERNAMLNWMRCCNVLYGCMYYVGMVLIQTECVCVYCLFRHFLCMFPLMSSGKQASRHSLFSIARF